MEEALSSGFHEVPVEGSGTPSHAEQDKDASEVHAESSLPVEQRVSAPAEVELPSVTSIRPDEIKEEELQDESMSPPVDAATREADAEDAERDDSDAEEERMGRPKQREKIDRTLPTAAGVSTRRTRTHNQDAETLKTGQEGDGHASQRSSRGRSSSSSGSSSDADSGSHRSSEGSRESSRSHGRDDNWRAAVSRPRRSNAASLLRHPDSLSTSAHRSTHTGSSTAARTKAEDAVEVLTQAAIRAQEQQLRHTLLSIFPPHLRAMASRLPADRQKEEKPADEKEERRAHVADQLLPTTYSAEPLVPLLEALCEDKAYVHAAWCRYEDDVAVQRAQNSILRKRQRHSFSKGTRKTAAASASSGHAPGDGEENSDDEHISADDTQPPEEEWVESPPGLCGPPHLPSSSLSSTASTTHAAAGAGFQWTPWRFFREKRRRGARRLPGAVNSLSSTATAGYAAAPITAAAATSSSATTSSQPSPAFSTSSTPASTISTTTAANTTGSGISSSHNGSTAVVSGGVPPLPFSEVPSLPVLQVEVDLPEDASASVAAMTPEEQKAYARYVMSSGKLRNVCRDPYSFLVSRAKEMRVQWERQHPFE